MKCIFYDNQDKLYVPSITKLVGELGLSESNEKKYCKYLLNMFLYMLKIIVYRIDLGYNSLEMNT